MGGALKVVPAVMFVLLLGDIGSALVVACHAPTNNDDGRGGQLANASYAPSVWAGEGSAHTHPSSTPTPAPCVPKKEEVCWKGYPRTRKQLQDQARASYKNLG